MAEFPPPLPLDPIVLDEVGVTIQAPLALIYAAVLCLVVAMFMGAIHYLRSMPPKGRTRRTTHAAEGVDASPVEASAPFPNLLRKH